MTALNDTGPYGEYELFYRHSSTMTAVYCVAYFVVFIVGLIGNSFVIAVVFRAPRMRTVTNFFIVNLALADVLVIVFCLPATLMSNIFVRKYTRYQMPDRHTRVQLWSNYPTVMIYGTMTVQRRCVMQLWFVYTQNSAALVRENGGIEPRE